MSPEAGPAQRAGVAWLVADMLLITAMSAFVKAEGVSYPAVQLVFIRAIVGLVLILPVAWRHRREIVGTRRAPRHVLRISCNAVALTANFAAVSALPLGLVTAIGFTRPLVTMVLALLMLGEAIRPGRWLGAAIGFCGVLVTVAPADFSGNIGIAAALVSVVFGSLATVQTRMLKDENTAVMMVFYTAGLGLLTAIPAFYDWQPVEGGDMATLLLIGVLAQSGQYCFLRAYKAAPASILAPVGYLSVVFAMATGFLFFGERPAPGMIVGVLVILAGLRIAAAFDRSKSGARR